MEYRTRSFRVDEEVWAAIQAHELSANKILRVALGLEASVVAVTTTARGLHDMIPVNGYDSAQELSVELDED